MSALDVFSSPTAATPSGKGRRGPAAAASSRTMVRPAWRRKGVGSVLLRAAEDRFKALGAVRADAMVLDSNDLGQVLWRANGYRRQDDWRRWVKELR